MTATLVFLACIMAVVIWWLVKPSLNAQPWVATGEMTEDEQARTELSLPPAMVGLGVFLTVVTSVFGLFLSAYLTRMEMPDWVELKDPGLLWVNTIVLVCASVAFQRARGLARTEDFSALKLPLVVGGLLTFVFIAGQAVTWRQLSAAGYYAITNPAYAFYYLLTGLHALHLLGGLWVWMRTVTGVFSAHDPEHQLRRVELCTVYWHFLLMVWAVLFALLLAT